MPRSLGVRQLPSKRCGCDRCRDTYPTPERKPTKNCSGSWQARWYKADGTRDSATRRRKDDAIAVRNAAVAAIEAGTWLDSKRGMIPLVEWRTIWLKGRAVENSTAARSTSHWNAHIRKPWGTVPLRAIGHQDVQNWVRQLEAQGLAPRTVADILGSLGVLMAAAKRDQRIGINPCEKVQVRPNKSRTPIADKPPTMTQIEQLAAAMPPAGTATRPRNLYGRIPLILLETGIRWGELAGLLPDCVDLEAGDLTVRRVLEEISGRVVLRDYPKSEAGHRAVPLTRAARSLFLAQFEEMPPADGIPVFRGAFGGWLRRADFHGRFWVPAAIASGVHRERELPTGRKEHWPTPHDVRHTFASRLENAGVPESVRKEVLGHEKPKRDVTWLYTHAPEDSREMVLEALGDVSGKPRQPVRGLRLAG